MRRMLLPTAILSTATAAAGQLFCRYGHMFKLYTSVCNTQVARQELVQTLMNERPGFAAFVEAAQADPRCRGQTLESFLIMPIQRIPRYELLLQRLAKHTPVDHVDAGRAEEGYKLICDIAAGLNEGMRRYTARR